MVATSPENTDHHTVTDLCLQARWTGDGEAVERVIAQLWGLGISVMNREYPHLRPFRDEVNHAVTIAAWKTIQACDGEGGIIYYFCEAVKHELREVAYQELGRRKGTPPIREYGIRLNTPLSLEYEVVDEDGPTTLGNLVSQTDLDARLEIQVLPEPGCLNCGAERLLRPGGQGYYGSRGLCLACARRRERAAKTTSTQGVCPTCGVVLYAGKAHNRGGYRCPSCGWNPNNPSTCQEC